MKIREIEGSQEEIIAYLKWHEGREDLIATIDDFESIHLPGKPTKSSKLPTLPLKIDDTTIVPNAMLSSNLGLRAKPQTILPTRPPSKERTAKLEAIFRDYLKAGFNAKAIQEHLIKEHDISMNGHQIAGWMGRMKQQEKHDADYKRVYDELISPCEKMLVNGRQMPEDAPKTELEGNCSPQAESVKEELIWIPACPGEEVTTKGGKSEVKASPLVECLSDLTQRPCNLSEPDLTILKMHQAGNMDIDIRQKLERMGHPMKVGDIRKRIDEIRRAEG